MAHALYAPVIALTTRERAFRGALVAQAIGRVGSYFNRELFGGPTMLPWGFRLRQRIARGLQAVRDLPTDVFLSELIRNLLLTGALGIGDLS